MDLQLCNSSQLTKWPRANKTIWDSTVGVNCNMQKFHSYHLLQTDLCSSTPAPHNTGHMHLSATMAKDLLWVFHSSFNTWDQSLPGVVHPISQLYTWTHTHTHNHTQKHSINWDNCSVIVMMFLWKQKMWNKDVILKLFRGRKNSKTECCLEYIFTTNPHCPLYLSDLSAPSPTHPLPHNTFIYLSI